MCVSRAAAQDAANPQEKAKGRVRAHKEREPGLGP
ncbi:hypothetical protein BJQ89_00875 [Arthrobacter sp. ES1]|nr:hypothetical protein [Arthrobacter sp. ES1]